ncbi:estradiol 17-beta-dehydrogenase 2 [Papilio machaon]|uniref:estradiol 17-beta-dehydrogenase 2 n=1 Tax=Papilio machaon TaxID=76193 RepID=UPI001E66455A|nr:estradiol 17-beta-dehydrogenase 2 [Papilio machaon]
MAAGDVTRRASITAPSMHRRPSARRGSLIKNPQTQSQEVPWDIIDRCALPIVLCHALAVVLSALLNAMHLSQISVFTLFLWFSISVTGSLWFYHNLQLRSDVCVGGLQVSPMEMGESTCLTYIVIFLCYQVTAAGKAVLVTGCDNVLGNALARRLDDLGYHVFAGFQNKAGNIDADMLKEDCSGRLHTLQLDITSETQILSASLYIVDHLPEGAQGLWAIVNCESWCALGELEWVPFSVIRRAMEVNLLGKFNVL